MTEASATEAKPLSVLADSATGILSALNRDGTAPFDFAAVQAGEDLDEVAASLERLSKRGRKSSRRVSQTVARLQVLVAERAAWAPSLAQVKRMRQWVLDAEHLLDGSWAQAAIL